MLPDLVMCWLLLVEHRVSYLCKTTSKHHPNYLQNEYKFCPHPAPELLRWYEVTAFHQIHVKTGRNCDDSSISGSYFNKKLEGALSILIIRSNQEQYYISIHYGVYMEGEYHSNLERCECLNCLKSASEIGTRTCSNSTYALIFFGIDTLPTKSGNFLPHLYFFSGFLVLF